MILDGCHEGERCERRRWGRSELSDCRRSGVQASNRPKGGS